MINQILAVVSSVVIGSSSLLGALPASVTLDAITDAGLKKCVQKELANNNRGETSLNALTSLSCNDGYATIKIQDLSGLGLMPNLESVNFRDSAIKDFTPVSNLKKIDSFSVEGNFYSLDLTQLPNGLNAMWADDVVPNLTEGWTKDWKEVGVGFKTADSQEQIDATSAAFPDVTFLNLDGDYTKYPNTKEGVYYNGNVTNAGQAYSLDGRYEGKLAVVGVELPFQVMFANGGAIDLAELSIMGGEHTLTETGVTFHERAAYSIEWRGNPPVTAGLEEGYTGSFVGMLNYVAIDASETPVPVEGNKGLQPVNGSITENDVTVQEFIDYSNPANMGMNRDYPMNSAADLNNALTESQSFPLYYTVTNNSTMSQTVTFDGTQRTDIVPNIVESAWNESIDLNTTTVRPSAAEGVATLSEKVTVAPGETVVVDTAHKFAAPNVVGVTTGTEDVKLWGYAHQKRIAFSSGTSYTSNHMSYSYSDLGYNFNSDCHVLQNCLSMGHLLGSPYVATEPVIDRPAPPVAENVYVETLPNVAVKDSLVFQLGYSSTLTNIELFNSAPEVEWVVDVNEQKVTVIPQDGTWGQSFTSEYRVTDNYNMTATALITVVIPEFVPPVEAPPIVVVPETPPVVEAPPVVVVPETPPVVEAPPVGIVPPEVIAPPVVVVPETPVETIETQTIKEGAVEEYTKSAIAPLLYALLFVGGILATVATVRALRKN